MRSLLARIGLLTIALSMCVVAQPDRAYGSESTSYTLQTTFPGDGVTGMATATSYALEDGSLTWQRKPLQSTSYQLLAETSTSGVRNVTPSGTEGTHGGTTGTQNTATNRRPRPIVASSASSAATTPASKTTSTSEQKPVDEEATLHPAAQAYDVLPTALPIMGEKTAHAGTARLSALRFFDVVGNECPPTGIVPAAATPSKHGGWWMLLIAMLILGVPRAMDIARNRRAKKREKNRKASLSGTKLLIALVVAGGIIASSHVSNTTVYAAQTVPAMHAYNGRLLNQDGSPVTSAVSIRFSYWTSADFVATDTTLSGAIDTAAPTYAGWQEVHTVTPNANGYFSVQLGSQTPLPDFASLSRATLLSLFLQVEVKPSAAANTAYELLDADPSQTTVDRSQDLSVPFAINAEMIDQREVGTGSGDIALLGPGGRFSASMMAGGTNEGIFTIDADETSATSVTLQFGGTLQKTLSYSAGAFVLNDDLVIQGNLTVGLINGIDISSLGSSVDVLRVTDGGGRTVLIAQGSYRLNATVVNYGGGSLVLPESATTYIFFGSGGLATNATGFPTDESFIALAVVTTDANDITSLVDRRIMNSDTREHATTIKMNPGFEHGSYEGDGTNNVGQLAILHDDTSQKNYYSWTSSQNTLQDYDIVVQVPLSTSLVRWLQTATDNPMSLTYRTSTASALENAIDLTINDTNGSPVTLSGSVSGLANTSWTTTNIEFTGTPTWEAGKDMTIRIRGYAKGTNAAEISSLILRYVTLDD